MVLKCWYFNINYIQFVRLLSLRWWWVIGTDYSLSVNQHRWRSHCVTGVSVKRPNDWSSINNQNIVWADSGLLECVVIYFKLKSCFPEVETLISFSATFLFSFPLTVWLLEPAVSRDHRRPFLSALFGFFHLKLGFACWMRTVYKSHEESIKSINVECSSICQYHGIVFSFFWSWSTSTAPRFLRITVRKSLCWNIKWQLNIQCWSWSIVDDFFAILCSVIRKVLRSRKMCPMKIAAPRDSHHHALSLKSQRQAATDVGLKLSQWRPPEWTSGSQRYFHSRLFNLRHRVFVSSPKGCVDCCFLQRLLEFWAQQEVVGTTLLLRWAKFFL